MSDARAEALKLYPVTADLKGKRWDEAGFPTGYSRASERSAYITGWAAAKADLPDRETLLGAVERAMGCNRRAHYGNVEQPYCGTHGGYGIWPCRESSTVADAVLSLLRGETKP